MDQRPIGGSATGSCTSFLKKEICCHLMKRGIQYSDENEVVYRHLFLWNHYCITR